MSNQDITDLHPASQLTFLLNNVNFKWGRFTQLVICYLTFSLISKHIHHSAHDNALKNDAFLLPETNVNCLVPSLFFLLDDPLSMATLLTTLCVIQTVQASSWVNLIGNQTQTESTGPYVSSATPLSNNSIMLAGYYYNGIPESQDPFIITLNSDGELTSAFSISIPGSLCYDISAFALDNEYFILGGTTNNTQAFFVCKIQGENLDGCWGITEIVGQTSAFTSGFALNNNTVLLRGFTGGQNLDVTLFRNMSVISGNYYTANVGSNSANSILLEDGCQLDVGTLATYPGQQGLVRKLKNTDILWAVKFIALSNFAFSGVAEQNGIVVACGNVYPTAVVLATLNYTTGALINLKVFGTSNSYWITVNDVFFVENQIVALGYIKDDPSNVANPLSIITHLNLTIDKVFTIRSADGNVIEDGAFTSGFPLGNNSFLAAGYDYSMGKIMGMAINFDPGPPNFPVGLTYSINTLELTPVNMVINSTALPSYPVTPFIPKLVKIPHVTINYDLESFWRFAPTSMPTRQPTNKPTRQPTNYPTGQPTNNPTGKPTNNPTGKPTNNPTGKPTNYPTGQPTNNPTGKPTNNPTGKPTNNPTGKPTNNPTGNPTNNPTGNPTNNPTGNPTNNPTGNPTNNPTGQPTNNPTGQPTNNPTGKPTNNPTGNPTNNPTGNPTNNPTGNPTNNPTGKPTNNPTGKPTNNPTGKPTNNPTGKPTNNPTGKPTNNPTGKPTNNPTGKPTNNPTGKPTNNPTGKPTNNPTGKPTNNPTGKPTNHPTGKPTNNPTGKPTNNPTGQPTNHPTGKPTNNPTGNPTNNPTGKPTNNPTGKPTNNPTGQPTNNPTRKPTNSPTGQPTQKPTTTPSSIPSSEPSSMPSMQPTLDSKKRGSLPIYASVLFGLCASGFAGGIIWLLYNRSVKLKTKVKFNAIVPHHEEKQNKEDAALNHMENGTSTPDKHEEQDILTDGVEAQNTPSTIIQIPSHISHTDVFSHASDEGLPEWLSHDLDRFESNHEEYTNDLDMFESNHEEYTNDNGNDLSLISNTASNPQHNSSGLSDRDPSSQMPQYDVRSVTDSVNIHVKSPTSHSNSNVASSHLGLFRSLSSFSSHSKTNTQIINMPNMGDDLQNFSFE